MSMKSESNTKFFGNLRALTQVVGGIALGGTAVAAFVETCCDYKITSGVFIDGLATGATGLVGFLAGYYVGGNVLDSVGKFVDFCHYNDQRIKDLGAASCFYSFGGMVGGVAACVTAGIMTPKAMYEWRHKDQNKEANVISDKALKTVFNLSAEDIIASKPNTVTFASAMKHQL